MKFLSNLKTLFFGEIPQREKEETLKREKFEIELGGTGTLIFSGIIQDEYLTELATISKRATAYDKMRRSDSMTQAVLLVQELPILSASWFIQPFSADPFDMEVAKFIESCLFEEMTITFNDFLKHALLMLQFGYSIFEKVFKMKNGKIVWKKFGPRHPSTVWSWDIDQEGGLKGFTQQVYIQDTYKEVKIPVNRLLVFTHNRIGSNFEGVSCLRPAYGHWWQKSKFYKIRAIGLERNAIGTPTITLPEGYTADDMKMAREIVRTWRVNDEAGLVLPPGFGWECMQGSINVEALERAILECDAKIAVSVLAPFLGLAERERGSYALAKAQSDIFLMSLNGIARNICDTFNKYAIKQLVDLNWRKDQIKGYPQLCCKQIGGIDRELLSNVLLRLGRAEFLRPDDPLEDYLRKVFELPERETVTVTKTEKARSSDEKQKQDLGTRETPVPSQKCGKIFRGPWRELEEIERGIPFQEYAELADMYLEEIASFSRSLLTRQAREFARDLMRHLKKVGAVNLERVVMKRLPRFKDSLLDYLMELWEHGTRQVESELGIKVRPMTSEVRRRLEGEAKRMAEETFDTIREKITTELVGVYIAKEKFPAVAQLIRTLSGKINLSATATAGSLIGRGLNIGRQEAERASQAAMWSAVMDGDTCPVCRYLDRQIILFENPEWGARKWVPGQVHPHCRCIWVWILKEQVKPVDTWRGAPDRVLAEAYLTKGPGRGEPL